MIRIIMCAAVALSLGATISPVRADVDLRLWLGAPGFYYVPGHGTVLRFGVRPRHHGHGPVRRYHGAKKYHGHVPARPYFWRYGDTARRYHGARYGYRFHDHRRYDSRRHGHGPRHHYRDSRARVYVY